jgi:lincosamide nucleotidyltransferase A/C/D/E
MISGLRRALRPLGSLLPSSLAERVRGALFPMPMAEVERVLALLDDVGLAVVVGGGWGIDALLGRATRRHRDLDLVVPSDADAEAVIDALASIGYRRVEGETPGGGWMPILLVTRNPRGRTVDILPVAKVAESGATTTGRIGGRTVTCLSPAIQSLFHSGYDQRPVDQRDLAALRALS